MILAAVNDDHSEVKLIQPDGDIEIGQSGKLKLFSFFFPNLNQDLLNQLFFPLSLSTKSDIPSPLISASLILPDSIIISPSLFASLSVNINSTAAGLTSSKKGSCEKKSYAFLKQLPLYHDSFLDKPRGT